MNRFTAALFACLLVALAAPSVRADGCPNVTLYTGEFAPSTPHPITVFPFHGGFQLDACRSAGGIAKPAEGYAQGDAADDCTVASGGPPAGGEMVVDDEFTVTGRPAGTPVTVTFGLQLYMQAVCRAPVGAGGIVRLTGSLREGTSNEDTFTLSSPDVQHPRGGSHLLKVVVHAISGTPFHLRYALRTEALEGDGDVGGLLFVYDSPSGLTIDSCGGFRIENPVPAHASTWGGLKARYR